MQVLDSADAARSQLHLTELAQHAQAVALNRRLAQRAPEQVRCHRGGALGHSVLRGRPQLLNHQLRSQGDAISLVHAAELGQLSR